MSRVVAGRVIRSSGLLVRLAWPWRSLTGISRVSWVSWVSWISRVAEISGIPGISRISVTNILYFRGSTEWRRLAPAFLSVVRRVRWEHSAGLASRVCSLSPVAFPQVSLPQISFSHVSFSQLHLFSALALGAISIIVAKRFQAGSFWVVFHRRTGRLISPWRVGLLWARGAPAAHIHMSRRHARVGFRLAAGPRGRASRHPCGFPGILL